MAKQDDECRCPCHTSKNRIVHVINRCFRCEVCNKNIKYEKYNEHIKTCGKTKNETST